MTSVLFLSFNLCYVIRNIVPNTYLYSLEVRCITCVDRGSFPFPSMKLRFWFSCLALDAFFFWKSFTNAIMCPMCDLQDLYSHEHVICLVALYSLDVYLFYSSWIVAGTYSFEFGFLGHVIRSFFSKERKRGLVEVWWTTVSEINVYYTYNTVDLVLLDRS